MTLGPHGDSSNKEKTPRRSVLPGEVCTKPQPPQRARCFGTLSVRYRT